MAASGFNPKRVSNSNKNILRVFQILVATKFINLILEKEEASMMVVYIYIYIDLRKGLSNKITLVQESHQSLLLTYFRKKKRFQ